MSQNPSTRPSCIHSDLPQKPAQAPSEPDTVELHLLNSISCELIHEQRTESLYEKIVDAAVRIMRSDFGSMQMLFPDRGAGGELRLLAFRGFNPQAAKFWEWVRADSKSTCGVALLTGRRVVAPDIATCEWMADSEDRETYLQTGIRACQTTALIARDGHVVGMISTHWRRPHLPSDRDFRIFDLLARQAADLIERTHREQELAERAALLDLSTDAIVVRDLEGRILYWSRGAERLYGWRREEAAGKIIHSLLQTQFPEPVEIINEKLSRDGHWKGELLHIARDGRRIIVLCRKVLDRGDRTGSRAVLETNTDLTERKRMESVARNQEQLLRRAERIAAAGQLAASLAHEINNPLAAVVNVLYLLDHEADLTPNARNLVATAERELARVSHIVKQSLTYYRAGTVSSEVDLSALIEESLTDFGHKLEAAGVQVTKKISPCAAVVGFPDEIRQSIGNLLLNALDARRDNGRLWISVRKSRSWTDPGRTGVRLTVADNGCGICRDDLPRIFEPFFTTKTDKGVGLGLWVVRGVVEKHGGSIRVRSRTTGTRTGTVISVLWPSTYQVRRVSQAVD